MTSQYVQCDAPGCKSAIDRWPVGQGYGDGTFGKMSGHAARSYAQTIGWTFVDGKDLCPLHSVPQAAPESP